MTSVRQACAVALPFVLAVSVVCTLGLTSNHALWSAPPQPAASVKDVFAETVRPIFTQFCIGCHNDKKISAGLTLEAFKTSADTKKARDLWESVKDLVATKKMPPKGKPQPTDDQR